MSKAKVVLTDYVWDNLDIEHEVLDDIASIVPLQVADPELFFPEAEDCDALLNNYTGPITAELMARMPQCRIIARYGIGVDTIDLDAATEAGIIVTNNPGYCIDEVVEHTMALLLASARKTVFYDRAVRNGEWAVKAGRPIPRVAGSTLGLVGFGNIARRVARAAIGLNMNVVFYDPFVEASPTDLEARKVSMQELLEVSDFVSLHTPLTADTRGFLGDEQFRQMKDSAIVINCARGPVIDTDALVRALDAGEIAGCALDTTDPEPLPQPHPLRDRDNVIINPHAAWLSEASIRSLQTGAPTEVRRVLSGQWPINVVNPAVAASNRAGIKP